VALDTISGPTSGRRSAYYMHPSKTKVTAGTRENACSECFRLRRKCVWRVIPSVAMPGKPPGTEVSCERCCRLSKPCIKRRAFKRGPRPKRTEGNSKFKSSPSSISGVSLSESPVMGVFTSPAHVDVDSSVESLPEESETGMVRLVLDSDDLRLYTGIFSNCGDDGTVRDLEMHEQSAKFWAEGMAEQGLTTCPQIVCCYIWGLMLIALRQKSLGRVAAASLLAVRCGVMVNTNLKQCEREFQ